MNDSDSTPYKSSVLDKIFLTLLIAAFISFIVYVFDYADERFDIQDEAEWASNIPVDGEYASIKEVKTWWTTPVDGEAKINVKLIPAATITLDSDSKSGNLRTVIYSYEELSNGKKMPKGDSSTLPFVDGKFTKTGTNSITIFGTDGYEKLDKFEYHRSQDEDRWTIEIKEAAPNETRMKQFKELGQAPIDIIRIFETK